MFWQRLPANFSRQKRLATSVRCVRRKRTAKHHAGSNYCFIPLYSSTIF